ncbi:MAG: helix-turn-helix transcriptional regulator [Rhodospirillales bacterium]|nr:helix-turn-helix transcriptional regulator [Rhodospirillales bacterium]
MGVPAAGRSFAETGFAGTTTRDIARRASLLQPSLCHNFGNTSAMLEVPIERADRLLVDHAA